MVPKENSRAGDLCVARSMGFEFTMCIAPLEILIKAYFHHLHLCKLIGIDRRIVVADEVARSRSDRMSRKPDGTLLFRDRYVSSRLRHGSQRFTYTKDEIEALPMTEP